MVQGRVDYSNPKYGSNAFRSLENWLEKRSHTSDRSGVRVFDSLQKLAAKYVMSF